MGKFRRLRPLGETGKADGRTGLMPAHKPGNFGIRRFRKEAAGFVEARYLFSRLRGQGLEKNAVLIPVIFFSGHEAKVFFKIRSVLKMTKGASHVFVFFVV